MKTILAALALTAGLAVPVHAEKTPIETDIDALAITFVASKICDKPLADLAGAVFPAIAEIFMTRHGFDRSGTAALVSVRVARIVTHIAGSDPAVGEAFCQNVSNGDF